MDRSNAEPATPVIPEWIAEINWGLLAEQKAWLDDQPEDSKKAGGLLALLDALQDYAIDDLGMDEDLVLFGIKKLTNQDHAMRAARALIAYVDSGQVECDDALPDLLTDLQHYCHQRGLDWDRACRFAKAHLAAELAADDQASTSPAQFESAWRPPSAAPDSCAVIWVAMHLNRTESVVERGTVVYDDRGAYLMLESRTPTVRHYWPPPFVVCWRPCVPPEFPHEFVKE